ncbi:MAG: HAD-IA family hydrolase [Kiritimatiellaeota bacterium]|nr:HAD-IA family hydrolase [Kiritimatiellota bacterium]
MKRQVLIFDLDGTLIDSRQDLATGINLMRRHYGLGPLPVETVAGFVGEGVRNLVSRSLQDVSFAVDLDEAVQVNKEFYRQHIHDATTLYPGVRDGLDQLARAGHALALLTNKPAGACHAILRHFKIDALFASVVGGDSGVPLKPNPEAVFAILQAVGGERTDAWMIGDNHTDIAAAHRAGIHSIFVTYGMGALGPEKPEVTSAGFDEVVALFLKDSQRGPSPQPKEFAR